MLHLLLLLLLLQLAIAADSSTVPCPAGTFSQSGFNDSTSPCTKCPAGVVSPPMARQVTSCGSAVACAPEFWCGPGAVAGQNYVQLFEHSTVSAYIVLGTVKNISVEYVKLVPGAYFLFRSSEPPTGGAQMVGNVTSPASESTFHVDFTLSVQSTSSAGTQVADTLTIEGRRLDDEPPDNNATSNSYYSTFTSVININAEIVGVVISPDTITYHALLGNSNNNNSSAPSVLLVAPPPVTEIRNPMCTFTLSYTATVCPYAMRYHKNQLGVLVGSSVVGFAPGTPTKMALPSNDGISHRLDLTYNFDVVDQKNNVTEWTFPAPVIRTCVTLDMVLRSVVPGSGDSSSSEASFSKSVYIDLTLMRSCPPGTVSVHGHNLQGCTPCLPGYYQPSAGRTSCFRVSPGFEMNADRTGMVECAVGTYSSALTLACTPCARGTYSDQRGSAECKPCPSGTFPTTLVEGATSEANCTTNSRQRAYKTSQGELAHCPTGTSCDVDGATVAMFNVKPGYFRTSNASTDIRECRPKFCEPRSSALLVAATTTAAVTAETSNTTTTLQPQQQPSVPAAATHNDQYFTRYCSPHHEGHMCETCALGFVHRGADRTCQPCVGQSQVLDSGRAAGIFAAFVIIALGLCAIVMYCGYEYYKPYSGSSLVNSLSPRALRRRLAGTSSSSPPPPPPTSPLHCRSCRPRRGWSTSPREFLDRALAYVDVGGTPLKTTIGYVQVVAGMAVVLHDHLPVYFSVLVDAFAFLSLDFAAVFDFGCALHDQTHLSALLFATLVPGGLLVMLFCLARLLSKYVESTAALHVAFVNVYLWIAYIIYPGTSKTILQTFICIEFDDGHSLLQADMQTECDSAMYQVMFIYAACCAVVFVCGIPLVCNVILDQQRYRLNPCPELDARISSAYREKDITVQGTRMLWSSYAPNRYNYEVFELVRKLLQTSAFMFVSHEALGQLVFLVGISCAFIVALGWLNPYVQHSDNALAHLAQWNILMIAFVAMLDTMGLASREDMVPGVILILLLVSVPVCAVVSAIRDSRQRSAKLLKEASSLLRRQISSPRIMARAASRLSMFSNRIMSTSSSLGGVSSPLASSGGGGLSGKRGTSMRFGRQQSQHAMGSIAELTEIIQSLGMSVAGTTTPAPLSMPQLARLVQLVDVLSTKLAEEKAVAKIERAMLRNQQDEQSQLQSKITNLTAENTQLSSTIEEMRENLGKLRWRNHQRLHQQQPGAATRVSAANDNDDNGEEEEEEEEANGGHRYTRRSGIAFFATRGASFRSAASTSSMFSPPPATPAAIPPPAAASAAVQVADNNATAQTSLTLEQQQLLLLI